MLDLINVRSNHAPLTYSGQDAKNTLQFMILTYLWPWNKVKVWIARPWTRLYSHKVWKTYLKQHSPKNQHWSFYQIRKHINHLTWMCAEVKNSGLFIIFLTYLTVLYIVSTSLDKSIRFRLKLFDIAVTLTYDQDHWKWYEQVKFNEQYHHAKFDIYYIHGVRVNPNVRR